MQKTQTTLTTQYSAAPGQPPVVVVVVVVLVLVLVVVVVVVVVAVVVVVVVGRPRVVVVVVVAVVVVGCQLLHEAGPQLNIKFKKHAFLQALSPKTKKSMLKTTFSSLEISHCHCTVNIRLILNGPQWLQNGSQIVVMLALVTQILCPPC